MSYVNGLLICNLPYGISAEELEKELRVQFPDEFEVPVKKKMLNVKVYQVQTSADGKKRQWATISGFEIILDELLRKTTGKFFSGTKCRWIFKEDTGEERDDFGQLLPGNTYTAEEVRKRNFLQGKISKKPMLIFKDDFLDKIGRKVFDGTHKVYVKSKSISKQEFGKAGNVGHIEPVKGVLRVHYGSSLEALQCIMLHNSTSIPFHNIDGTSMSEFKAKHGLGLDGAILNVAGLQVAGYVPFDQIYADVFDVNKINSIESFCWRCEEKFQIIGVDSNLNYLAGRCKCLYLSELDVMDKKRAYFWKGDTFTRLILGFKYNSSESQVEGDKVPQWKIFHQPLKRFYNDGEEYRHIVGPVLQENWKHDAKDFKDTNQCDGVIVDFKKIETIAGNEVNKAVFTVSVSVNTGKFWTEASFKQIGGLTFTQVKIVSTIARYISTGKVKARIVHMLDKDNNKTIIVAKVEILENECLILNSTVHVVPKPVKTEYNLTRKILNKWNKTPEKFPVLNCILNSKSNGKFSASKETSRKPLKSQERIRFHALFEDLNEAQKMGVSTAMKNPLSIIQGPPGTGKTFTAGALAMDCAVKELGTVLGTTSSNYAADGLAERIARTALDYKLPFKILRMYSEKHEAHMMRSNDRGDCGNNVTILHEAVRQSEKWLSVENPELLNIRKKLEAKKQDMLTTREEELLKEHTKELEQEIMNKHEIIVATVGTLADGRVRSWNSPRKISTVIIDEAAQMTQAATLSVFLFKQHRTVIIGDHQQLVAQLNSYSAKIAGLPLSTMEWFKKSDTNIPWTMLIEQHRMSPANRAIISQLCYDGKLQDAKNIKDRKPKEIEMMLEKWLPSLSSPVIFIKHKNPEKKMGTSYYNKEEMKMCVIICERLLELGFQKSEITLLTFYEAQRFAINKALKMNFAVRNVDAFQGRENTVTVLSMVRGGFDNIGFASTMNRLNVGTSRARKLLIVICNADTYKMHASKAVSGYLRLLEENGDVRTQKDLEEKIQK